MNYTLILLTILGIVYEFSTLTHSNNSNLTHSNIYEFKYPDSVKEISWNIRNFAKELYLNHASRTAGNLFFSPFGVTVSLVMVYLGSSGKTQDQIRSMMHLPENKTIVENAFYDLIRDFEYERQDFILDTSNRVYIDDDLSVWDNYETLVNENFLSSIHEIDFGNYASATESINSDIEQDTNFKISDLFSKDDFEKDMKLTIKMVLANAMHFKGNWKYPFDSEDTRNSTFWVTPCESIKVPTMSIKRNFLFAYNIELDATFLSVDYEDGRSSFNILLPNRRDGIAQLEEKLPVVDLHSLRLWTIELAFELTLPKFEIEDTLPIKSILEDMGVIDLFDTAANLSGISHSRYFYVSQAKQKAFIEVGEEGSFATESIGFQIFHFTELDGKPTFKVDHPFFFYIQDNRSKQILFTGRVTDIPEQSLNDKDTL